MTLIPPEKLFAPLSVTVPPPSTVSAEPTPLIGPEMARLLPDSGASNTLPTSPSGALIAWFPPETAMLAVFPPLLRYNVPPVPWAIV